MKITALIADDESPLRDYLTSLLQDCWPELDNIIHADNGVEALKSIIKHRPNIAFLDINMPGLTGIQVAEQCKGECHIVFVTAYDQYAIEAFENEAIDYLLKPVNKERLCETKKRLQQRIQYEPGNLSNILTKLKNYKTPLQWLKVVYQEEVKLINVLEVDYFQSNDKYTSAFVKGKEFIFRRSLKNLEEELDNDEFWRVHRGTLVRVKAIESITKTLSGQLFINIGTHQMSVSRAYQHLFKQD